MSVGEMHFAFEQAWQAQEGFDAVRAFIAGNNMLTADPHLDGVEITVRRFDVLEPVDLDDDQCFFMQLCFYWASQISSSSFTGTGCLRSADGSLSAEKVFYDGYMLGFKHLDGQQSVPDELAWREAHWHLWFPLHGHFVNLEEWRTSSDL